MNSSNLTPECQVKARNGSEKSFTLRHTMTREEVNIHGHIHGGTMLTLMTEAAYMIAARHCNQGQSGGDNQLQPILARLEGMDFKCAAHVGEVAELHGRVIYTSPHSLLITVHLYANNPDASAECYRRHTNTAQLWFVCIQSGDLKNNVVPVRQYDGERDEQAHTLYERRKENGMKGLKIEDSLGDVNSEHSVAYSQQVLTQLVSPADMTPYGCWKPGVILKLMDECAGMVAMRHCRARTVTVGFSQLNFTSRLSKPGLMSAHGIATFNSNRSLEVYVTAYKEIPWKRGDHKKVIAHGYVCYASVDDEGKTLPMPALQVQGEAQQERYDAGSRRYEQSKKDRAMAKKRKIEEVL